eukprot:CAMPEP_0178595612 /NCGR_PEP_ID=MMETSP0697-20121206/31169_1 /TAXON_ID=265572 /ORGANISM="Extubocellulus spinifer, Strain CCMP396" /LENGTH=1012 /DNA_ID=CAMNT_0020233059 /DNA_START=63 /DNA_END=3102 /DNA_ORIENTATION=-
MPPAVGGGSRTSPGGWDKEGGGGSTTTTGTSTSSSTSGAAAYRSAMGPAAATAGSAEDEQNLLDWIGDSVKSAVDSIFVLPGAEDGSTAVNGGNAVPSASSSLLRASGITSAASGESGGAARTKIVKGLRRGTAAAGAGSSGDSGNARTRNKSSVSFGSSAPSPWSAGTSTTGTSSTGAGATRGVSSTAYASSAGSPASTGTASAAATRTAKRGSLSPPSDTSSPIGTGASRTTTASTAMRKQKYKRAQSSPPPSTGLSVDESAQRKTKRTAKGGGILQRSSTTIIDSIGSIGRGGDYTGSSSAPAAAAKRKLNRRLSEQYAEREAGGADVIATTICKSSSLDDEGGVKRLSKLPPLPPKASRKADASWTAIHDMLIDELFEESRREYLSKQHRSAHGQEKADHRHHGDRKDAKLGWKIGHFLHPGGGGGGGHGADGVHIISDDKSQRSSSKAAKKDDVTSPFFSPEGASKRGGGGSKDVANGGGIFSGLPWTSSTDANQGKKSRSRLRLKRPISFRRRKEREEESERGGLAASVSAAVAAAAAAVTSSAGATSHNSSDGAPSSPPDKHQKDAKAPTESAASSPFLPRISRLSPSKRRVLGGSARGNAFQQGSPIRSTGDYTGRSDPNPGTYLHPQCRLQKDKGRGEVPGTAAIVASREGSLEKIRAKVDVIIEVEQSGSTTSSRAKLRLKPAVLVDSYSDGIIETRSVISVKMGFLFLKYGILLRWDADSGLVNLIVLRKMCSPGFLDGNDASVAVDKKSNVVEADAARGSASSPSTSLSRQTLLKSNSAKRSKRSVNGSPSKHGFVIGRLVDGANAILHGRWDSESNGGGTEVAHLGPPYLVDRPDQFAGASLSVTVLKASGLCAGESKRSDWAMNPYVRLSIGPESHRTKAVKMTTSPTWTMSTNNSCRLAVSNNPRDDDQHLKVELYDWRPFRRDRILGVVFVPVASVEPQKGNDAGGNDDRADERDALQATEVTIPVRMMRNKKGPYGCVTMSLIQEMTTYVGSKRN